MYPIYSSLETLEQRAIFDPAPRGKRKIILSTNIAQTSITVPGIRYVVDCGFVKQKMYDPKTHMDALVVVPLSQAAATQRAGRAGRTQQGKVYRLYSRETFEDMEPNTVPEIQRSSLIGTVLALKKIGIEDVMKFEFIDPLDPELLVAAIKDLFLLGAVDDIGHLTPLGRQLSDFPISPFLSRSLVSAALDFHCSDELLTIAAMMSVEDVFTSPRSKKKQVRADEARARFQDSTGDHITFLNIYDEWKAQDYSRDWCFDNFIHHRAIKNAQKIRDQLSDLMRKLKLPILKCPLTRKNRLDPVPILKSLASAFYVHTGKRHPQRPFYYPYLSSVGGNTDSVSTSDLMALHINPQSALAAHPDSAPEWVIYNDIQYVTRAQMRIVSRIDFSMVRVLLSRVKLMDIAKLAGGKTLHLEPGKPRWVSESGQESTGPSTHESLEFDKVQEIIDEQHHSEMIHTIQGDIPLESHKSAIPESKLNQAAQERERELKKAEYRERYLKRKR